MQLQHLLLVSDSELILESQPNCLSCRERPTSLIGRSTNDRQLLLSAAPHTKPNKLPLCLIGRAMYDSVHTTIFHDNVALFNVLQDCDNINITH
jgi:hypothetical protein